jgi:hypothetical protein
MGNNNVHYFLNVIKYYSEYMELIPGQSAVRMPFHAPHHESFSKHFPHFFSVRSLHDNCLLINNIYKSRNFSAQSAQVSDSGFLTMMHQLQLTFAHAVG